MWVYKKDDISSEKQNLLKYFKNDLTKCGELCSLYYNLTDKWFETYIAEYFRKIHNFDTKVNWWFDDKWIDVYWIRIINWTEQKLIVQCKQWHWNSTRWHIKKDHIWAFDSDINDHKDKNTFIYYITTTRITKNALEKAKEKWIIVKWYKELVEEVYLKYPFEEFSKFILNWNHIYNSKKIFEKKYLDEISLINNKKEITKTSIIKETTISLNSFNEIFIWIALDDKIKKVDYKKEIWNFFNFLRKSIIAILAFWFILFIIGSINNKSQTSSNFEQSNQTTSPIIESSASQPEVIKNTKKNVKRIRNVN